MKLTAKQEAFCQAIAEGKTQADSYRYAYPNNMTDKQIWEKASLLMTDAKVKERVKELQAVTIKRHEFNVDAAINEYEEARVIAKEDRNPAAMVAATTGKSKVTGIIIDKSEHKQAGEVTLIHKVEWVLVNPKSRTTDKDRAGS